MKKFYIIIFVILFFCSRKQVDSPTVAKVGDNVLTIKMIENAMGVDNIHSVDFDVKKDYVEKWTERELLYREAVERGLMDELSVKETLLNLQKELVVDKLLDLEVEENLKATNEEINEYYKKNSQYFKFDEAEYRYEHIMVKRQSDSKLVQNALKMNKTFSEISKEIKDVLVVRKSSDNVYIKETSISPEILNTISTMKNNSWRMVGLKDGYHFIYLFDKKEKGTLMDLNLVKNEIISKILVQKRKDKYNQLINNLKDNANVEINYSEIGFLGDKTNIKTDTTKSQ